MSQPLKLIFMGSPEFSVPCLEALIASSHKVVAVYCQPPRPAGRGKKLRPTAVQQCAEKHDIAVHYPKSLKSAEEQEIFADYQADAAIVSAYGLLLPQAILDAPTHGCINVHPSDLPRWRGAAPLHRTIMAGDIHTALCIMQMDAGLDTGDILSRELMEIPFGTTTGQLHDMMAAKAGKAVLQVLAQIQNATVIATPQPTASITYANKISKQEARIDWNQPAKTILSHIYGLSPFPAAVTEYNDTKIKILEAELVEETQLNAQAGIVTDDQLTIACSQGTIRPILLQREGKRPMQREEFLRGFAINKGEAFA